MREIIIFLVTLHALIHLIGFVKAFKPGMIKQFKLPISKGNGLLWLVACMLFLTSALLLFNQNDLWWIPAAAATFVSQYLVILVWPDAKFGTLGNAMLLALIALRY